MITSRAVQKPRSSRLGAIELDILRELTISDLLISFLVSGRSIKRMNQVAQQRAVQRHRRKLAVERLSQRGFIKKSGDLVCIRDKGRHAVDVTVRNVRRSLKTRKWDGKWRIVAYDIPERFKPLRDAVRLTLKNAGFVKFQDSLWIFPHECRELATLIQKESRLRMCVLYGVLEKIENEERLKRHFSL